MSSPSGKSIVEALRGAGEVGSDLLAVDWDTTPLGSPQRWPRSLQTIVQVVLGSRFSMWMAWGPELTFFCNDAYRRDTLAKKYPWALGRSAREVWAEIWDDIGPRIEAVMRTGEATWDQSLLLFLERSGYVEETYHTFSYSPLTDDSGVIAGMLCVVSEETDRVIGERTMATLRDLGSESTTGRDDIAYLQAAARHLEANRRSLPFTLVYLFDGAASEARLAACTGIEAGHVAAPELVEIRTAREVWPISEARRGRTVVVEDLDRRFERLPTGEWSEPPTAAVMLPLAQPDPRARPYGFLVVGANRYRPLDDQYRSFLALVAAQLASGVAGTRAYEAERRRAEELAELDRAKTAFFTNISHELRTPLTLLLGPAEDALADREHPLGAAQRRRLEIIARNGDRLLKLVNTLLDFSRLESGRVVGSFEPVDLAAYTGEVASMFESAVQRAGLELRIDCPPLSEPVYVDREMWAKIVLNLLSNALKFTFTGGITVSLRERDGTVELTVADTGIGIEPADQEHLFQRFHRVLGARARTFEGSGIGLALVAELAGLHGGRPRVDSVPGSGSTFTIEVPLGSEHLPAEQVAAAAREVSVEREVAGFLAEARRWLEPGGEDATSEVGHEQTDRPQILVVDDNADMREYVSTLLADRYSVRGAGDGQAALELARAHPPDLILTDVMMPRLDGFGLLAALRADPMLMNVPVVMLSARAGEEGVVEGLEAGADDYLVKPFSARELMARVHANLELDRVRRTRDQLERGLKLVNEAERLAEVGSWEVELADGAVTGSDQLLRMLRLGRPEFESLRFPEVITDVIDREDQEWVRRRLESAIASGTPFDYEARLSRRAGADRWVRVRGEVVCDEDGRATRLRGSCQDITQRRVAERAIATAAVAREAAAREHRIADALQRSLLPPVTVDSDYLEVATYYQAGVEGTSVGGDWYDAVDLGAGRVALIVGDVVGRGIAAASVMGQLRAAARAYAQLDLPPSEVLELLDAIVRELGQDQLVTCIYGIYDPAGSEFRYANAGHLPPLLVHAGELPERLPTAGGPPLGAGPWEVEEHRLVLPLGTMIALYTDGLVERRDRDLDAGISTLAGQLVSGGESIAELADRVVGALAPDGSEDDIAILLARVCAESAPHTAVLEVPAEPSALRSARAFTDSTLRGWSLADEVLDDAALILSELLTNAIVHGAPPIRVRLRRTRDELAIEVDDGASAMPRKLRSTPDDEHGRGLAIVAHLGNRWAARPQGHGKTVWSTLPLAAGGGRKNGQQESVGAGRV